MAERRGSGAKAGGAALAPGDRLPPLMLPAASGGAPVPLRPAARDSIAIIYLARPGGRAAAGYLRGLEGSAGELRDWSARLLIVLGDGMAEVAETDSRAGSPWPTATDPTGAVRSLLGLEPGKSALVVADRWGQVYHVTRTDSPADLPAAREIISWARFLATQCPECGVPDEPGGGEWSG